MVFGKKKDVPKEKVAVRLHIGVKDEARLNLSNAGVFTLDLVAPGLSAEAVNAVLGAVGEDGYLVVDVVRRADAEGKDDHQH